MNVLTPLRAASPIPSLNRTVSRTCRTQYSALAISWPAADPVTRQIQVLVDIPNPGGKLVAGLYAEGRVSIEKREALLVPLAVVDMSGDQPSVLRVKNGVVERAVIATGLRDERAEVIEVTNGVAAGDVLLMSRATKNIAPGTKVEIAGSAPKQAATPPPAVDAGTAPVAKPETK